MKIFKTDEMERRCIRLSVFRLSRERAKSTPNPHRVMTLKFSLHTMQDELGLDDERFASLCKEFGVEPTSLV